MNVVIKNIKDTLAELFGFKKTPKNEEWGNEYLEKLVESGEVTPDDEVAFKESERTRAEFLKRLEDDGSKSEEAKGKTKTGKQKVIKPQEQSNDVEQVVARTKNKGSEREQ